METLTVASTAQLFPPKPPCLMTSSLSSKLPHLRLAPAAFRRLYAAVSAPSTLTPEPETVTVPKKHSNPNPSPNGTRRGNKKANFDAEQLKLDWLNSISSPLSESSSELGNGWVIGIDPDLSGALAVLKPDDSSQVYDSPHLKVAVGGRVRKRLDVKSIIQLLQSIEAPIGTTAYIEQSIPYPQDGKQGWWSGGFGYGLWIGILVASGYSVVPVPSLLWKNEFKLAGNRSSKDDSRELASTLFPSMSSLLKRKKDHGRAEALLIAAYGKGLKVDLHSSRILEELTT